MPAVRAYFRKIAKRNVKKAEHFERAAAMVDALKVLADLADDSDASDATATRTEAVVNDMLDELLDTMGQNVHVVANKVGAGFSILDARCAAGRRSTSRTRHSSSISAAPHLQSTSWMTKMFCSR